MAARAEKPNAKKTKKIILDKQTFKESITVQYHHIRSLEYVTQS